MSAMSDIQHARIPPWGKAVSGATGAVLANTLMYPLDMIKTRLQVQDKQRPQSGVLQDSDGVHYSSTWDAISRIVNEDGVGALYAGMNSALIGVASTNFAFFYWNSITRSVYFACKRPMVAPGMATDLALGAVAAAAAQVCTIPVAVVTTRQQTQGKRERKGLLDTAQEVIDGEDGWSGLWKGLKASLILVVNPSITYAAYPALQRVIFPGREQLRAWEVFMLGAISKSLATIVTQPFIVAKVGLQSKPPPSRQGKSFKTFVEVMQFIVKNEGLTGLFKGISPQVTKGLLVQGFLMMTKERLDLLFVLFFHYWRKKGSEQLRRTSKMMAPNTSHVKPLLTK